MEKKYLRKLQLAPNKPGVYRMRDKDGEIIYVGKALNLKNRLKSYFTGTPADEKTKSLVENIDDFDYIITVSEYEALVLEANLIKKHRPHYNIRLKDDKQYPFIRISNEPFPRIFVTREQVRDGSQYFGPYTDARAVRRTLRLIEWIFPIRTCTREIPEKEIIYERPCMNYQMGKCPAPCVGYVKKDEYKQTVVQIVRFLQGKDHEVAENIQQEMQEYSDNLEFEKAAKMRDRLMHIEKLMASQNVYFTDGKDRDVIGLYIEGERAVISVLKVLSGKLLNREIHELENAKDQSEAQLLAAFVQQYYSQIIDRDGTLPYRIYVQNEPEEYETLNGWLKNRLVVPQRGDNRKLMLMARENAFNYVEELKLKNLRKKHRTIFPIQELKDKLGLPQLPRKIACFDISTIQGSETVSSMVFSENGRMKKRNYRHYTMKTVDGQDDFASMEETLTRYLAKIDEQEKPDLIVIDGGKGQLGRAWSVLQKSGVEGIEMISLAKRIEEVFRPGSSESVILPRSSSALRLLIKVRDEAHRFAITFHRKKRSMRTLVSELDTIKGVGSEKKFLLLKMFGSVENLRKASVEKLQQVPGIGEKTARYILETLNSPQPPL